MVLDLSNPIFSVQIASGCFHFKPRCVGPLEGPAMKPVDSEMRITCKAFGKLEKSWEIVVKAGSDQKCPTVEAVLRAIHTCMMAQLTLDEWLSLGQTEMSHSQSSFFRRVKSHFSWGESRKGIRRVDLLEEKYYFGGLRPVNCDESLHLELLVKSK